MGNRKMSVDDLESAIAKGEAGSASVVRDEMFADPNVSFSQAFLTMQSQLPVVPKSRKGFVASYAPYETIMRYISPVLIRNNFSISHSQQIDSHNQLSYVVTKLAHISGGELVSSYPIPSAKFGKDQDIGKSLTYGKRYNTVLLTGVSVEGEPDADGEASNNGSNLDF